MLYQVATWVKRSKPAHLTKQIVAKPIPLRKAALIALHTQSAINDFRGRQSHRLNLIDRIVNNKRVNDDDLRKVLLAYHGTKIQDELWVLERLTEDERKATMIVFDKWKEGAMKPRVKLSWEEKKKIRKEIKETWTPEHVRKKNR